MPRSFLKIRAEFEVRVVGREAMESGIEICCRAQMLIRLCVQLGMHLLGIITEFPSSSVHPQLFESHWFSWSE